MTLAALPAAQDVEGPLSPPWGGWNEVWEAEACPASAGAWVARGAPWVRGRFGGQVNLLTGAFSAC